MIREEIVVADEVAEEHATAPDEGPLHEDVELVSVDDVASDVAS